MVKFISKLSLLVASLALLVGVAVPVSVSATDNNEYENENVKVNICHATSSQENPWEAINTSDDHSGHEQDFAYAGPLDDQDKPDKANGSDEWCENNQPGDKCANIDGKQTAVPAGKVLDNDGNCVDPTPVVPTTPQVLGTTTQVVAPTGSVNAGGGSTGNTAAQLFGLVTSVVVVAAGFAVRKFAL